MSVLVDTGVLYADHDEDASRHGVADAALDEVYAGTRGQPHVSDYIYDEAVTLTRRRAGTFGAAKTIGERIRGAGSFPDTFVMLRVSRAVFEDAVDAFERYDDQSLSFTDATTVALARRHDVDTVLSFDDDFDGIVDRTDPAALVE